jgi:flagellar hook-associated protein 2
MTTSTSSLSSSSALSGSGTLSSAGIGSGLDVNGIVSKLMAIERQPINQIDANTTAVQAEITAYGTLKGSLSSLQTAVQTLTSASTYAATKTSVADTTQLSATSDSTAAVGNHTVQVTQLATTEKLQSAPFASATDSIGTGTLTFDFGTYSTDATSGATSFALNTNKKSVSVTIPSGSDSLNSIADAINAAKAGISATVLNDGTSNYLSFSPLDGGSANSLRISVQDADGNNSDASGLSRLAFDKTSGSTTGNVSFSSPTSVAVSAASSNNSFMLALNGGTAVQVTVPNGTYNSTNLTTLVSNVQSAVDTALGGSGKAKVSLNASNQLVISSLATSGPSSVTLSGVTGNSGLNSLFGASGTSVSAANNMTESVAPVDAKLIVDGVSVTKSSNTITDAIRGITLNLTAKGTAATTISITRDNSTLSSGIDAFVKAYNTTSAMLKDLLSYDPTTGTAGALQSEGTVRSIQAELRTTLETLTRGSGLNGLSDIGVSFQRDGTLAFNTDKLNTALSDPTKNVQALFIGTGSNNTTDGVANKLSNLLDSFLQNDGMLTARTDGLNQEITDNAKRKADLETRMTAIEARYRKQYSDLDTLISSMNSTQQSLTQELASLPSITSSK